MVQVDHWDMLNNFCFHVYAQKKMFVGENGNTFLAVFDRIGSTRAPDIRVHKADSQLIIGIQIITRMPSTMFKLKHLIPYNSGR